MSKWEMVKLGDSCSHITKGSMAYKALTELCIINMGQSPDSSSYNQEERGLPFYQGNADFGEIHPNARIWCDSPNKIADGGDILISVRAPIGALNIALEKCCIGRGLAALKPIPTECNQSYLYYALLSKVGELNSKGTGSTFKAISKKTLSDLWIPFRALPEQKKIVDTLDAVSELLKLRKQQLSELDLLVKSQFIEMFGDPVNNDKQWNQISLGALCDIGSSKRIFEKEYVNKGIPFYRTKEVVELSKGNKISTELFIAPERFEEIRSVYGAPQKDDLLISAVGTIGVIWIVDGQNDFYFKDGNLIRVSASTLFNSVFMKFLLECLIKNYKVQMSTGTAYSALTISGLKEMLICDVPMELQNQFAGFVEQVDKSKFEVQKAIDETQTLFDSLMQEYFC